jgi:large subunit ribosomal protein L2
MINNKLLVKKKNYLGKNNSGKIIFRSRCLGHKKKFRFVNFKLSSILLNGIILKLSKDPNRNNIIALVNFNLNKFFSPYLLNNILATNNLKVGSLFIKNSFTLYNNIMKLKYIKKGIFFNQIEKYKGIGSQYVRSSGTYAKFNFKLNNFISIILPSKKNLLFSEDSFVFIGSIAKTKLIVKKKAGFNFFLGKRPHVRGVAMNSVDHPHGGGRGKSKSNKQPRSPYGLLAKGKKTIKK